MDDFINQRLDFFSVNPPVSSGIGKSEGEANSPKAGARENAQKKMVTIEDSQEIEKYRSYIPVRLSISVIGGEIAEALNSVKNSEPESQHKNPLPDHTVVEIRGTVLEKEMLKSELDELCDKGRRTCSPPSFVGR